MYYNSVRIKNVVDDSEGQMLLGANSTFYFLNLSDHVVRMEDRMRAFKFITCKPTGKIPLGRPRRRWKGQY